MSPNAPAHGDGTAGASVAAKGAAAHALGRGGPTVAARDPSLDSTEDEDQIEAAPPSEKDIERAEITEQIRKAKTMR